MQNAVALQLYNMYARQCAEYAQTVQMLNQDETLLYTSIILRDLYKIKQEVDFGLLLRYLYRIKQEVDLGHLGIGELKIAMRKQKALLDDQNYRLALQVQLREQQLEQLYAMHRQYEHLYVQHEPLYE
jgi:hypothetical protein